MSDSVPVMNEVVARLGAAVENLTRNVDRLVDAQMQTTTLIQDLSKNQAIGTTTLAEHEDDIDDLKTNLEDLQKTVSDHKGNWKVVTVAGLVFIPTFTTLVGAVAHLWFK